MMTTNLFAIANVKQLRTYVVLEFDCLFFRTSWCVGVLKSAIFFFNSFHNWVEFGMTFWRAFGISEGGEGLNTGTLPPWVRHCTSVVSFAFVKGISSQFRKGVRRSDDSTFRECERKHYTMVWTFREQLPQMKDGKWMPSAMTHREPRLASGHSRPRYCSCNHPVDNRRVLKSCSTTVLLCVTKCWRGGSSLLCHKIMENF